MENQVIKVLNKEHGQKVIEYWKEQGVNTNNLIGDSSCDRTSSCYYGVIEGRFDYYHIIEVQNYNAEIIELPEEKKNYTVQDLSDGKVVLYNNGTKEELVQVLKKAFPTVKEHSSSWIYYFRYECDKERYNVSNVNTTRLPTQSLKDFVTIEVDPYKEFREAFERGETIQVYVNDKCKWVDVYIKPFFNAPPECYRVKPKEWKPKRGERVLVWDSGMDKKNERIFLTEIEGTSRPFYVVPECEEKNFLEGKPFATLPYTQMSSIPKKIKVSIQEIANWKGVDVEQIEIV